MWQRYWNSAWQTLTYDYENRLVSVSGSGTGSFAYDADGNRVWQDVDGTEIHYVWDWVESGTVYYYFGGRKVVMRNVSGLTYLYADQVSSTTNTSNAQPSSQRYYPYGDKRGTNSVVTPYQYTGQRWEDAIGLYFYQARWYDAARRRFIQPDSIVPEPGNPQALNRYSYGLNNPVKYSDPSGHNPLLVGALIGGLVGGGVAYVPQVLDNLKNGQSLGDAALNVDWGKVAGAAVGGAVAGGTLGLGTTLGAGFLGTMALGGLGGVAGGQASAVTEASYHQLDSFMHGHGWSNNELVRGAFEAGFLDPKTMIFDAAGGAISAGLGYAMGKVVAPVFARFGDQVFSGGVPMIRVMPGKGPLCASIFWSGREVIIPASTLEQIVKAAAEGLYDVASELIQQLVDAEAQQWLEQQSSQGVP